MEYRQRPPDSRLNRFVEAIWSLSGAGGAGLDPIFPDGRCELVVHRRAPFQRVLDGGRPERQAAMLFAGQMRSPAFLIPGAEAEVVGVRFRPNGAAAFLPIPQHELADAIVDVRALQVRWLVLLLERARSASSVDEATDLIERGLLARIANQRPASSRLDYALDVLVASGGRGSIDTLAGQSGLSRRQLERVFNREVGLSPKVFARILRFQAALEGADQSQTWGDVAQAHGYADQSHLIRDFRALAGEAPTRILHQAGELTRIFLRGV